MAKISPVYTFLGPELGQKKEKIKKIKAELIKIYGNIEEERYYADETPFSEILPRLETVGLFSDHNLITIENADAITGKEAASLASYLDKPVNETTIFLLSEKTKLSNTIEKKLKKYPFEIFWELNESNKSSLVYKIIRDNNLAIEKEAVELFIELISPQSDQITRECMRLVSFFPEGHTITEDDLEKFIYHSKEETVFSLFSFMAVRDLNKSLESAKTLLNQSSSGVYQITGGLLWQLRKLLALKIMITSGYGATEACNKCGIRGLTLKQSMLSAAKNYSLSDIKKALALISLCDKRIRLYRRELHENIFLHTVYKIVFNPSVKKRLA